MRDSRNAAARPVRTAFSLLATLAACGGSAPPPAPEAPTAAVTAFLAAVKANDLQRMGRLWGSERGPAADWMKSQELHQRVTVIQRYLAHQGSRIVEGPLPSPEGSSDVRTFRVELQRYNCNVVVPLDVVRARSGGWIVVDVHLEAAGNPVAPCRPPGAGTRP